MTVYISYRAIVSFKQDGIYKSIYMSQYKESVYETVTGNWNVFKHSYVSKHSLVLCVFIYTMESYSTYLYETCFFI